LIPFFFKNTQKWQCFDFDFFSNNQNQQVLQKSNTHSTLVMDHGTTSAGAGSHKALPSIISQHLVM
jgi:hypothetical protein